MDNDRLALINIGTMLDLINSYNLDETQSIGFIVGDALFTDKFATLGELKRVFELAASEFASRQGCDVNDIVEVEFMGEVIEVDFADFSRKRDEERNGGGGVG